MTDVFWALLWPFIIVVIVAVGFFAAIILSRMGMRERDREWTTQETVAAAEGAASQPAAAQ
jgi:hypothetical protein